MALITYELAKGLDLMMAKELDLMKLIGCCKRDRD